MTHGRRGRKALNSTDGNGRTRASPVAAQRRVLYNGQPSASRAETGAARCKGGEAGCRSSSHSTRLALSPLLVDYQKAFAGVSSRHGRKAQGGV